MFNFNFHIDKIILHLENNILGKSLLFNINLLCYMINVRLGLLNVHYPFVQQK